MSTLTRTTPHSPPSLPSFAQTFSHLATNQQDPLHRKKHSLDDHHQQQQQHPIKREPSSEAPEPKKRRVERPDASPRSNPATSPPQHPSPKSNPNTNTTPTPTPAPAIPTALTLPTQSFTRRRRQTQTQSPSTRAMPPAPILTTPSSSSTSIASSFPTPLNLASTLREKDRGGRFDVEPSVRSAPVNGGFGLSRPYVFGSSSSNSTGMMHLPKLSGHKAAAASSAIASTTPSMRVPELPSVPMTPGSARRVNSVGTGEKPVRSTSSLRTATLPGRFANTTAISSTSIAVPPTPAFASTTISSFTRPSASSSTHPPPPYHLHPGHHANASHASPYLPQAPKTAIPFTTASSSTSLAVPPPGIRTSAVLADRERGATRLGGNPDGAVERDPHRASFLRLFEDFYDALADSKVLKAWLQEQLARTGRLVEVLEEQAQRGSGRRGSLDATAAALSSSSSSGGDWPDLLERKLAPLKNEMEGLKKRMGELEEMLYYERRGGEKERQREMVREREREREREMIRREMAGENAATAAAGEKTAEEGKETEAGVSVSTSAVRDEMRAME